MSAYSTLYVSRKEAEDLVRKVRSKVNKDPVSELTDEQLDEELNEYAYSGAHTDVVGVLYNYILKHEA